jgi:hypothetical protein
VPRIESRPSLPGLALALATLVLACVSPAVALTVPEGDEPILLDGRCELPEYRGASRVDLGHGVEMLLIRSGWHLGLCVPLRPGSFGTTDLFLVTPRQAVPLNLHVSAQIGERRLEAGRWPEWAFWNHRMWAAPWVPFEGFDGEGAERRPRWGTGGAREMALDIRRFGEGRWLFRIEMRRVMDEGQKEVAALVHPVGTVSENEIGWDAFDVAPLGSLISQREPTFADGVGFRALDLVDLSRWSDPSRPDTVRAFVWYPAAVGNQPKFATWADLAAAANPAVSSGLGAHGPGAGAGPLAPPRQGSLESTARDVVARGTYGADLLALRAEIERYGGEAAEAQAKTLLSQVSPAVANAPRICEPPAPASSAVPAVARSAASRGACPLVLLASPLAPWAHDALASRLAASGIVVAQIKPATTRDLALAVQELPRALGDVDARRLAVVAYGSGSIEASLFAMRHAGLAAFVSIDGAEGWSSGMRRLEAHPDFAPQRLRMPWLRFEATGRGATDRRFFDLAAGIRGWEVGVGGLAPSDFFAPLGLSSLGHLANRLPRVVAPAVDAPGWLVDSARTIETDITSFLGERFGRPGATAVTWRPERPAASAASAGGRWTALAFAPLRDAAIALDGRTDETIWKRAQRLPFADGSLAVAADRDYLYVAVRRAEAAHFSSEVWLDVDASRDETWAPGDWWLHSSNSLCESAGEAERYERCGRALLWSATNTQSTVLGDAAEYSVAWRKLGLAGPPARIGIAARWMAPGRSAVWPAAAVVERPATWGLVDLPETEGEPTVRP